MTPKAIQKGELGNRCCSILLARARALVAEMSVPSAGWFPLEGALQQSFTGLRAGWLGAFESRFMDLGHRHFLTGSSGVDVALTTKEVGIWISFRVWAAPVISAGAQRAECRRVGW